LPLQILEKLLTFKKCWFDEITLTIFFRQKRYVRHARQRGFFKILASHHFEEFGLLKIPARSQS
jgi:hypothetical protein